MNNDNENHCKRCGLFYAKVGSSMWIHMLTKGIESAVPANVAHELRKKTLRYLNGEVDGCDDRARGYVASASRRELARRSKSQALHELQDPS